MINNIIREITPLTPNDCFTISSREKHTFDFPLHAHEELELNLIINGKGVKRVVGDHIGTISDIELVLIGSNLPHGWFIDRFSDETIKEVTIQFGRDLISEHLLHRNQFTHIRKMLNNAHNGILFSQEISTALKTKIFNINQNGCFNLVLELFSLLHQLSVSGGQQKLSQSSFSNVRVDYNSRRIERVFDFISKNFHHQIKLEDVSRLANMQPGSFSRFVKRRTGMTFVEILNGVRLGQVSRMLIDTTQPIAEIAFQCGFNNMANFNRIFKHKKGCTPKEFKHNYHHEMILI